MTMTRFEARPLAEDPAGRGDLHVVFKVGDADYMLAASTVLQMESYTGATPVPGTPPYVAGIVQVRGKVVPVVDLRVRFGGAAMPVVLDNRIIVGQHGDRVVALLVDAAREVVALKPSQLEPPPPIVARQARGFVSAVAKVGERLVMLVDFAKVIGEEQLDGNG
jgi:purine-binding chemotaxis protein CheW